MQPRGGPVPSHVGEADVKQIYVTGCRSGKATETSSTRTRGWDLRPSAGWSRTEVHSAPGRIRGCVCLVASVLSGLVAGSRGNQLALSCRGTFKVSDVELLVSSLLQVGDIELTKIDVCYPTLTQLKA